MGDQERPPKSKTVPGGKTQFGVPEEAWKKSNADQRDEIVTIFRQTNPGEDVVTVEVMNLFQKQGVVLVQRKKLDELD
jgi:hypothetical protein